VSRDLHALPKAHLHLHFTGAMRHATMLELAESHGITLPDSLLDPAPQRLAATDERGWFRFQRLYDHARDVIRTPEDVRRLVREVAEDEAADGSGWLEIQVDPSGYAARFGGLTSFVELVLDAVADACRSSGVGIGLVVGANRTRHPLDARTLARLAAQYAGRGVVGFGLANDERRGRAEDFARAFRIARAAGLASVPHGGELMGADSVRACLEHLGADRVGHGIRSVEDPHVLADVVERGVTLEVCPTSNVGLGVYAGPKDVPLRVLIDSGARVALGADDPLLFGSRLTEQYAIARDVHGCSDEELNTLARQSVEGSRASPEVRARLLGAIDAWLGQGVAG
jgi:adenosine deaminase